MFFRDEDDMLGREPTEPAAEAEPITPLRLDIAILLFGAAVGFGRIAFEIVEFLF